MLTQTFSGLVLLIWIFTATGTTRGLSSSQEVNTEGTDVGSLQESASNGLLCLVLGGNKEPKLCPVTHKFLRPLPMPPSEENVGPVDVDASDDGDLDNLSDERETQKIQNELPLLVKFYKRALYKKLGLGSVPAGEGRLAVPTYIGNDLMGDMRGRDFGHWLNEGTGNYRMSQLVGANPAAGYFSDEVNPVHKRMISSLRNRSDMSPRPTSSAGRRIFIGFPMFDNVLYRHGRDYAISRPQGRNKQG